MLSVDVKLFFVYCDYFLFYFSYYVTSGNSLSSIHDGYPLLFLSENGDVVDGNLSFPYGAHYQPLLYHHDEMLLMPSFLKHDCHPLLLCAGV
mmetsp:Transcript_25990/g.34098  ORF Transcript_25990/g.34098 Transcript_25990/m.34098 type:complete len:92 (-) Transcript_25990:1003-1278(-)